MSFPKTWSYSLTPLSPPDQTNTPAPGIEATAQERKISRNAAFDLEVAALTKGRDTRLERVTKATAEA